MIEGLVLISL
ncbi:unnamed protein product [Lathyrus oleraceus]